MATRVCSAIAVCCLLILGTTVQASEAEAIAAVKKLGGTYKDGEINLHGKKITGEEPEWELIKTLPATAIDLGHNPKMRNGHEHIWAMTSLKSVTLGGMGGLKGEAFKGIVALKNLEEFDTHHSGVDAAAYIEALPQLPKVHFAFVDNIGDDDVEAFIAAVKQMPSIKTLRLAHSKKGGNLSEAGIMKLAALDDTLESLVFINYVTTEAVVNKLDQAMPGTEVRGSYRVLKK